MSFLSGPCSQILWLSFDLISPLHFAVMVMDLLSGSPDVARFGEFSTHILCDSLLLDRGQG